MIRNVLCIVLMLLVFSNAHGQRRYERDTLRTDNGKTLIVTFLGGASLLFDYEGTRIYFDPTTYTGSFSNLPTADYIFITSHHKDHCDKRAVDAIASPGTKLFVSDKAKYVVNRGMVLFNWQDIRIDGLRIEAIPSYSDFKNNEGKPYHPRGEGNGYIITVGGTRIFVAGDTQNTEELRSLKWIDIAFLPLKAPFTMSPQAFTEAVTAFQPKVVYPYNYRGTDPRELEVLLEDSGIELRIRRM